MKHDSRRLQMLADYDAMTAKFGPLDFREFATLWNEADALMAGAIGEGFRPDEVPSLYSWLKADESRLE